MKIDTLQLKSFRNYTTVDMNFNTDIAIVVGDNAQGKTNFVESIYTLAFSKSYRSKAIKDLIKMQTDFAKITADISFQNENPKKIEYIITGQGKKIKVNNVEQKVKSDFVGILKVIKFSPEDLELVKGSPKIRRKFLDMYLSQLDKHYLYALVNYNHLIKQKNALLKQKQADKQLLSIYNDKLVEFIVVIHNKRREFIAEFLPIVQEVFASIVDDKEIFNFQYQSIFNETENNADIRLILEQQVEREIQNYGALVGIHKDDLQFFIDEYNAKQFASQGQQRTIVLACIIALVTYLHDKIGEYPILILDDVMSELDNNRKLQLLASFKKEMQIFMTTTTIDDIVEKIEEPFSLYYVEAGTIREMSEN